MGLDTNQTALPDAAPQPAAGQDRTAGQDMDAPASFTAAQQALIDSIIANEKKQARLSVLKEIGDVDALKTKAAKLDELEAAQMSEMEKLQAKIKDMETQQEQLRQQADTERLNALRLRVGQEQGLPPEVSELLKGDDVEALTEHAKTLLEAFKIDPVARIPNLDATAGTRQQGPRGMKLTPEQENALARAQSVDPTMTRERYITALRSLQGEG